MRIDRAELWTLPGYGDQLDERDPGLRKRIAELGPDPDFADVVASINPIPGEIRCLKASGVPASARPVRAAR